MHDLTQGSITGHVARFALFIFVTMMFQTLYFLVDLYFVSDISPQAVAAVALSGNLMFIVMAITQALSVGTTTLVSHAIGAQNREESNRIFNQAQVLATTTGVAFFALALLLRESYAQFFAADAETARLAVEYLEWFIPAMALQFLMLALIAALRGAGDVKIATIAQTLSLIVNIILAPVFIAGWGTGYAMGVAGAGLATLIAIIVGTLLLFWMFQKPDFHLHFNVQQWRPDFTLWKRLLAIGLPAGGEFGLMAVYLGVIYFILGNVNVDAQAGFGIGIRVMQALFVPALAIAFALAPIAGQNFGANRLDRLRETILVGLKLTTALMLVLLLVCQLLPHALIEFFSEDAGVIDVGSTFLSIISINFVASGVIFCCGGIFQGIGNTLPPLMASGMRIFLFAIPALWLAQRSDFRLEHLWYLSVGSVAIQAVVLAVLLWREFRRRGIAAAVAQT